MSSMKYYTNVVPTHIYSKLLEKGMPELLETYAEVFDWLITKGINICIYPDRYSYERNETWRYVCYGKYNYTPSNSKEWVDIANDALYTVINHML